MASVVSRSTSVSSSTADRATAASATTTRISRTRRTRSDIRSGASPLRAVFLQFVEQGLLADPQDLCRAGFVVFGVLERQLDQRALGLFDGLADPEVHLSLIAGGNTAGRRRR